jgi:hypothetical protein
MDHHDKLPGSRFADVVENVATESSGNHKTQQIAIGYPYLLETEAIEDHLVVRLTQAEAGGAKTVQFRLKALDPTMLFRSRVNRGCQTALTSDKLWK